MFVSDDQVRAYHRDGFVAVRSLFDPELAAELGDAGRSAIARAVEEASGDLLTRPGSDGEPVVDRLEPLVGRFGWFDDAVADPDLVESASRVLGGPAALFKEKIILKAPGTRGYDLHQDFAYWQHSGGDPHTMTTAVLALDSADRHNGAIEVFAGQHRSLLTRPGVPEDPAPGVVDLSRGTILDLSPGDVMFMHSLTPHRSAPNGSSRSRAALYFTFMTGDPRGTREAYYRDHQEVHAHEVFRPGRTER